MNPDYIAAIEKSIEAKKEELAQMMAGNVKFQKCHIIREEIFNKQRRLAKAKEDWKKAQRRGL